MPKIHSQVLGRNAGYSDWIKVSENAREFCVKNACEQCARRGVGVVNYKDVLGLVNTLYAQEANRSFKVSFVFGSAFSSLVAQS